MADPSVTALPSTEQTDGRDHRIRTASLDQHEGRDSPMTGYQGSDDIERDRTATQEALDLIEKGRARIHPPAVYLIAAERSRQIAVEGWTPEHDAGHAAGELTAAALCYLSAALCIINPSDPRAAPAIYEPPVAPYWPWEPAAYKVSLSDPLRSLVKAGALIAAEIDRLQVLDV